MNSSIETLTEVLILLKKDWEINLKPFGVKPLTQLISKNGKLILNSLVLCILKKNENKFLSKKELTSTVSSYTNKIHNDIQQARHLGLQYGWNIRQTKVDGEDGYVLINTTEPHPHFKNARRVDTITDWEGLKQRYNYQCAVCGSTEGQYNLKFIHKLVKLEKGHMDPRKAMTDDNIIPTCDCCNKFYKNFAVFDELGRIVEFNRQGIMLTN
jgi:hypothetical protein